MLYVAPTATHVGHALLRRESKFPNDKWRCETRIFVQQSQMQPKGCNFKQAISCGKMIGKPVHADEPGIY